MMGLLVALVVPSVPSSSSVVSFRPPGHRGRAPTAHSWTSKTYTPLTKSHHLDANSGPHFHVKVNIYYYTTLFPTTSHPPPATSPRPTRSVRSLRGTGVPPPFSGVGDQKVQKTTILAPSTSNTRQSVQTVRCGGRRHK